MHRDGTGLCKLGHILGLSTGWNAYSKRVCDLYPFDMRMRMPNDCAGQERGAIRVLLVDDHMMVRQGLRTVLESYDDIEVVGEAADGKESLECVEHLRPSVVVMDLSMPQMNGVDATTVIKARHPETIVLGLSVNATQYNRTAMTNAGASGFLTKEAAVEHLYDLIQHTIAEKL